MGCPSFTTVSSGQVLGGASDGLRVVLIAGRTMDARPAELVIESSAAVLVAAAILKTIVESEPGHLYAEPIAQFLAALPEPEGE